MKAVTKITFYDDAGEKFFGEGPARLLRGIEETGSLNAAAKAMGMGTVWIRQGLAQYQTPSLGHGIADYQIEHLRELIEIL